MNQGKIKQYVLNGSFHTLEIKSDLPKNQSKLSKNVITTSVNQSGSEATSKINPNKYDGDIFTFSDFERAFNAILDDVGIDNYRLTRADMRFDNYNKNHYLAFAKLNRYIISALMLSYTQNKDRENAYRTLKLLSDEQISIAVKNDYFEAENYDRDWKNQITNNKNEPAKARLEERTMARQWRKLNNCTISLHENDWNMELLKEEFTHGWSIRWNKAKQNLKLVQSAYNEELLKKYRENKNAFPVQFNGLTDFLIQNQNSIFTSMQMVDLLTRLNEENPELKIRNPVEKAKYHKKNYGIEYISQKDVDYAINEITRATHEYFDN